MVRFLGVILVPLRDFDHQIGGRQDGLGDPRALMTKDQAERKPVVRVQIVGATGGPPPQTRGRAS